MPKQVTITPEVRDVLARCTVTGPANSPVVILPMGQLDRPLYEGVDKVLKALGGKWNRKLGGHAFARPVEGQLAEALRSGVAVDEKRTAEQFFTPIAIARQMADLLDLPRADVQRILEPSAGGGALVQAAAEHGVACVIIERDERLAGQLAERAAPDDVVICADFMEWEPHPGAAPIDAVLMNPPFSRGQDMAHVTRALDFLRVGGQLVAIMSPHWTFAQEAAAVRFRGLVNSYQSTWEPLPDGSFREAGTNVSAGILTIHKGII